MASSNEATLGQELMFTLEAVNVLIPLATSPAELETLQKTRAELLRQVGALVDANLERGSQEYQAATRSLQAASGSIQNAIKGMESVAKAVQTLAQALDLVARLMPA